MRIAVLTNFFYSLNGPSAPQALGLIMVVLVWFSPCPISFIVPLHVLL